MCWKFSDEHVHYPHLKAVGVVAAAVAHQSDNKRVLPSMGSWKHDGKKFDQNWDASSSTQKILSCFVLKFDEWLWCFIVRCLPGILTSFLGPEYGLAQCWSWPSGVVIRREANPNNGNHQAWPWFTCAKYDFCWRFAAWKSHISS